MNVDASELVIHLFNDKIMSIKILIEKMHIVNPSNSKLFQGDARFGVK